MSARTHRPLALRLGLVLGIAVLAVLFLAGLVVNRVVSSSFQSVVTAQQQQRLDDAALTVAVRWDRPAGIQTLVRRLATTLGGEIRVVTPDGTTVAAFGTAPDSDAATYAAPVVVDDAAVASLEATLPASGSGRGFLPLFNATLLLAGLVSVVIIVLLSTAVADRLTRPLRDVAGAARRLERGESGARATGGEDAESAELALAFNAMADRLERSEMLRRRAASDLAHDLATPATVLQSQLQAMLDGVVPTDRANLEAARSTAAALGGLVGDLGDLADAEAAPLQVRPAMLEVDAAVDEAVRALDALARERDVGVVVAASADLVAWADPGHVARALQNVLANAIGHSRRGTAVTVEAGRDGAAIAIRVRDAGPGIDPVDLPHVFERFYRADPARTADAATTAASGARAGHGLGLTIARELLVANGGTIAVASTGPTGTTFLMTLPGAGPAA